MSGRDPGGFAGTLCSAPGGLALPWPSPGSVVAPPGTPIGLCPPLGRDPLLETPEGVGDSHSLHMLRLPGCLLLFHFRDTEKPRDGEITAPVPPPLPGTPPSTCVPTVRGARSWTPVLMLTLELVGSASQDSCLGAGDNLAGRAKVSALPGSHGRTQPGWAGHPGVNGESRWPGDSRGHAPGRVAASQKMTHGGLGGSRARASSSRRGDATCSCPVSLPLPCGPCPLPSVPCPLSPCPVLPAPA